MIMHFWDWAIVLGLLGVMLFAALSTRKYNKSVVDFLSAGRCARKYVLGVAEGLSSVGAISIVALFEAYYKGGFSAAWWFMIMLLTQVLVAMSGWIAYRYRQTRALTLAQILEMRYSKNFRVFAGFVIFISGTLNFGIFPAVAARFFQYYFGWEPIIVMVGSFPLDLVYAGVMAVLTIIALFFVFAGGQITIMLTDFIQGTFANISLVIIVIFILIAVPWSDITDAIGKRDSMPMEPVATQALPLDYSNIKALGEPGVDSSEKYMLAPVTRMVFDKEGDTLVQSSSQKGNQVPDKILFKVEPDKALLSGTDYTAAFSYKSSGDNQYSMIVMTTEGRQQSQNLILPSTDGKVRQVNVPFKSTNIGHADLFFAQAGTGKTKFKVTTPVQIDLQNQQSMINPFNAAGTEDFSWHFFLIQAVVIFWTYKAWQGTQGYYSAAINAHEARMGGVVGNLRIMVQNMMILIIPVAAYAILFGQGHQEIAAEVTEHMASLPTETMQNQLRTTFVLTKVLPVGLIGAFAAVMMAAFIGTNGTYMHSWGSIFVQDIYLPMSKKKKELSPTEHFKVLRWAIAGVGIFAFFFSLFFDQNSAILMYFAFTGTIWLGGAGAVIALGLYWSRGTTAGAYTSIITGMVLAIAGFICQQDFGWIAWFGVKFPLNSQWVMLIAMGTSTILYVIVSLITCRTPHNMDKLLHRGEYATDDATATAKDTTKRKRRTLMELIGIDKNFSFFDKILYIFVTGWSAVIAIVFLVGFVLNKSGKMGIEQWQSFWHTYILVAVGLGIVTAIWFSIGGCIDLVDLLRRLKNQTSDDADDGRVENGDEV